MLNKKTLNAHNKDKAGRKWREKKKKDNEKKYKFS